MSFAKILFQIDLGIAPVVGESIGCYIDIASSNYIIVEDAAVQRTQPLEFTGAGQTGGDRLINIRDAMVADWGVTGGVRPNPVTFTIVNTPNWGIEIEATEFGHEFIPLQGYPSWVTNVVVTPEVLPTDLEIDQITVSTADTLSTCNNARFDIAVNNDAGEYPINILINGLISKTANNAGELFNDYPRFPQPQWTIQLVGQTSSTVVQNLPRVSTWTLDGVDVLETISSATATINTTKTNLGDIDGLNRQYSLNGVDYGVSNIFYGLLPDTYTAYAKDDYGCIQTTQFEVVGVATDKPDPIFRINEANSLKFYRETSFSPCGDIPNFNNAPVWMQRYYNVEMQKYLQMVQQCDTTVIQVDSNYDNMSVSVQDCEGIEIATVTPTEEIINLNLQDKRDCQLKAGDPGKTLVYYISGNTYLPEAGTYEIANGLLPDFASDGNIEAGITMSITSTSVNGTFVVEQSVFDESINGYALQISAEFTGVDGEQGITDALYNDEDYNIWQFVINWSLIDEGNYKVYVSGTDPLPNYPDASLISEPISLMEVQNNHTLIEYTSAENIAGINYSTGITHKLRVPARYIDWRDGGESENFVSDDGKRVQLRAIVTDEVHLEVQYVPQYLIKKISLASGHSDLQINGETCVLTEKGESESKLSENNPFYTFSAWYQVGEGIETATGGGVISDTGRVLGVNGRVLGVG
jgi:hypothetical protein